MSEKLAVKQPIYPLIGLAFSLLVIVFGVVSARSAACLWFLLGMWLVTLVFGYWRACLAVVPVAVILCGIFGGITYGISQDVLATYGAVNRLLAVCVAVIPGLALPPIVLVRNFSTLGLPRMVTLGMMITLTFFPLLGGEVRQVREAMKTRGAGGLLNPQIFYRAFLIPLVMRLVNISDTLALSVETRGFDKDAKDYSVYQTVHLRAADILFLLLTLAGVIWVVMQ